MLQKSVPVESVAHVVWLDDPPGLPKAGTYKEALPSSVQLLSSTWKSPCARLIWQLPSSGTWMTPPPAPPLLSTFDTPMTLRSKCGPDGPPLPRLAAACPRRTRVHETCRANLCDAARSRLRGRAQNDGRSSMAGLPVAVAARFGRMYRAISQCSRAGWRFKII
jgi:hypothetical protein